MESSEDLNRYCQPTWCKITLINLLIIITGFLSLGCLGQITLSVNGAIYHSSISTGGEEDWYMFQTGLVGDYTIETYGSTDVYLYLYDNDQSTLIDENDDGGSGTNSKITVTLIADSWYYLKVRGYSSSTIGDYDIGVVSSSAPTPKILYFDAPAYNSFLSPAQVEWYKFETGIAGEYTLETHGSTDMYMYLYDSDQNTLIAENDDGGSGTNSKITANLNAGTWYYVKVRGYSSSTTGNYSIDVKKGSASIVALIVDAAATNASLNAGEDDWYRFQTGPETNYTIETYGSTDIYMYLYQSDQATLITENDDGGSGTNSRIQARLNANTWYYVKVRGYSTSTTGAYSIDVKTDDPVPVVTLTVDGPRYNSAIVALGEEDWYRFQTSTAGNYTIETYGSTDMYMYLYSWDRTTLIAENDDGGSGTNSKITASLSAGAWYYVKVRGYSTSTTGLYSIDVKRALPDAVTLRVNAFPAGFEYSAEGEEDWYRFQTGLTGEYLIATYGGLTDYMVLYQSDRTTIIAEKAERDPDITRILSANSEYYIMVRGGPGDLDDFYYIGVDVDVESTHAQILEPDAPPQSFALSIGGEEDWYRFRPDVYGEHIIETYGSTDVYMSLYEDDMITLISENDDGGTGTNSKITSTVSSSPWYYVKIRGYSGSTTGAYSIDVESPLPTATVLTIDGPTYYALISDPDDRDWYKFYSGAGGAITTETHGTTDTYIHYMDSDFRGVYQPGGGIDGNVKVIDDCDPYSWYYITITGQAGSTGVYSINLKRGVRPTLESPEDGAIMDNGCFDYSNLLTWRFEWLNHYLAQTFHLQVQNINYSVPSIDLDNITTGEYTFSAYTFTMPDAQYGWRWKVRAKSDGLWGPWSEIRSFDCEPVNTDCGGGKSANVTSITERGSINGLAHMNTSMETSNKLSLEKMVVFPNPTDGVFTIQLEGAKANKLEVHITDAAGRFIIQRTIPQGATMLREEFDFRDKPAGVYFLHIINGEDHRVGKVVVH